MYVSLSVADLYIATSAFTNVRAVSRDNEPFHDLSEPAIEQFGTYRIKQQRKLTCANAQTRKSLCCSHIQSLNVDKSGMR